MTLTALVAAYDVEAGALRAALPLAGATLVEHQLRRLAAAGAEHPILLVEAMTAALAAPLARLRADGIAVSLSTSIADAADRLAAAPRVLILADACLPNGALIDRLATAPVPSIAVVPDLPDHAAFERIDATHRWAGIALLNGRRIAELAQMVGDWDPISTLLRSAVQEHAERVEAARDVPVFAGSTDAIHAAEALLIGNSREAAHGWADRYIEAPVAEALLPQLFARRIQPELPALLAASLAAAGGIAALAELRWPALLALLLSGPLARMGRRLALIQARRPPGARRLGTIRLAGLGLGAIGLARGLTAAGNQWGWLLAATVMLAAMGALPLLRRIVLWLGGGEDPVWAATPGALAWAILPFAIAGQWAAGLAALTVYAAGTAGAALLRAARLAR